MRKYKNYVKSGVETLINKDGEYQSGMMLLGLLRKAQAPLYMFDAIVDWAKSSVINFHVSFDSNTDIKRKKTLENAAKKFNMEGLVPELFD